MTPPRQPPTMLKAHLSPRLVITQSFAMLTPSLFLTLLMSAFTIAFYQVPNSHCLTVYGTLSLRRVPAYTETSTKTWLSVTVVTSSPTVTVIANGELESSIKTATSGELEGIESDNVLKATNDEEPQGSPRILRSRLEDTTTPSALPQIAISEYSDPASPIYAQRGLAALRNHRPKEGHPRQPIFPRHISCRRTVTRVIRSTSTKTIEPSTLIVVPTVTRMEDVMPRIVTMRVPVTVYESLRAKNRFDRMGVETGDGEL